MNKNTTKNDSKLLLFSFNDSLSADFEGGQISSDGGLVLLREFDKKTSYFQGLNACIRDPRSSYLVIHEQEELLRQRIFQIALGYEDADDSDLLRYDPLFQLTVKNGRIEKLASQPTMSRLENRISEEEIARINNFLVDNYIKSRKNPPKEIVLDLDSTDDPTHGCQQLSMFNGYYGENMYHPLLISEASSQLLVGFFLRPGNVHTSHDVLEYLEPVIKKLKEFFPEARIIIREDAGFSFPEMYTFCENKKLELGYAISIASNSVLQKKAQKTLSRARKCFKKSKKKEPIRLYTSFRYQTKSWKKKRRVVVKVEITKEGEDIRFVVANMKGEAKDIYKFFSQRGECENRIKEVKNGFKADRLSCHGFWANYFRLLLHACAYNFIILFKDNLGKTELAEAQIETLRLKLLKVGVWIKQTVRKIWAHISSSWPFRGIFQQVYFAIRGSPAYSLA